MSPESGFFRTSSARVAWAFALALSVALEMTASANVGETYGFGSRTAALGGAGVAWGFEGFAAYANPAGLGLTGDKKLVLSFGVIEMTPHFTPINHVVTENNYTSTVNQGSPVSGSVDTSYRDTFGQEIGLAYRLPPEAYGISLGVTTYLPLNQLAYMDTGETFEPEYVLYRARTQRPQVEMAAAIEPVPGLFFGAGLHLGFSLTANATVFLQTQQNHPSTIRFSSALKPKVAPYFGVLWAPNSGFKNVTEPQPEPVGSFSLGGVVRLPLASTNTMVLKSGARALGDIASLDFNFGAASALFYDPLTFELGGSLQYLPRSRIYGQVDYEVWSQYQVPSLIINDPKTDTSVTGGIVISPGTAPDYHFRNILVPRVGHEFTLDNGTALRAGYSFKPSVLSGLPTGAGNYLDPARHNFNVGVGFKFKHFLGFDTNWNLDTHLSYQWLVTQHITKTPGDELGRGTGDEKIGAPGYDAGGKIYGGGISLTLGF